MRAGKIPEQFLRAKHAKKGVIEVEFLFSLRTGVASVGWPSVAAVSRKRL